MNTLAIDGLTDLWDRVFSTQPDPDLWVVVATAVAALLVVVPHPLWRLSRNAITIAHEGGHGLVALATGRRLDGIRLHSDTSGLTVSRGKPTGIGMILTAAAGYTAPPLLGLGGAALLGAGYITLLLWLATGLLLVMLVMIRNAYGVLTVILSGGRSCSSPGWRAPRCRPRSRTPWCGSWCWAGYGPRSSSRRSGGGAGRVTPTRISSHGSPMSRRACGSSSSTRCRCAPS